MLARNKNPKFRLSFNILELTNLPQLSGSCYVKWSVRELSIINRLSNNGHHSLDDTDPSGHTSAGVDPVKPLSSTPVTRSMRTDSGRSLNIFGNNKNSTNHPNKSLEVNSNTSMESDSSKSSTEFNTNSIFGKHHKGVTDLFKIENHKVGFHFSQEMEIKFEYSRLPNKELNLRDKFLILQIYLNSHDYLGEIRINLLDYVIKNYKRKVHVHRNNKTLDKYLLQHSKINSIISLIIEVELIKGDYSSIINTDRLTRIISSGETNYKSDSHNQSTNTTSGNSNNNINPIKSNGNSIKDDITSITSNSKLPHLRINNSKNGSPRSSNVKNSPPSSPLSKMTHSLASPLNFHNHHLISFTSSLANNGGSARNLEELQAITMKNMRDSMMMSTHDANEQDSDIIDALYYETLKVEWDPRPGEFNPKECIEDIFHGGNGWKRTIDGINYIDSTEGYYYNNSKNEEFSGRGNYWKNNNGVGPRFRRGNTTISASKNGNRKTRGIYSQEGMSVDEAPTVKGLKKADSYTR